MTDNKNTFASLLKEHGYNGNSFSKKSEIAVMTISDLKNGKTEFKKCTVNNAIKISTALGMSVEDIYNYLYG